MPVAHYNCGVHHAGDPFSVLLETTLEQIAISKHINSLTGQLLLVCFFLLSVCARVHVS